VLGGLLVTAIAALALAQYATGGELLGSGRSEDWHWDKPAVVDGRTVHLAFDGGSCDEKRWVETEETDTSVTLTVHVREQRGSCSGVGLAGLRLDAHLDEPLGDRELIDGACLGGDEPARGNCPKPVQRGACGTADYQVDLPIDDGGNATLRVRLERAVPGQTWQFRWTLKDYDESRVDSTEASADAEGHLEATRSMGQLPADLLKARIVEFAPTGGTFCEVKGHLPMFYGS
jgi:hypothetical protein